MVKSTHSAKFKKRVCMACENKCESYMRTGHPGYAPGKSHSIPKGSWYDTPVLYQYCIHFDQIQASEDLQKIVEER